MNTQEAPRPVSSINAASVDVQTVSPDSYTNGDVPPPADGDTKAGEGGGEEPKPFTLPQILTLGVLCATNICSANYYSLLAPFFPTEATLKKGISETEAGVILGVFQVVVLLTSPIFGVLMTQIGCRFMYITAMFVGGTCGILFGILEYCPPGTIYLVMCLSTRSVEALACAASTTASFAIAAYNFPGRISTVFGLLEASGCIGLMTGPPLGGVLYSAGGFKLPFLVTGSIFILCGVVSCKIMPTQKEGSPEQPPVSKWTLLASPCIWAVGFLVFIGQGAIGFMDIALSIHLQQFNLSKAIIGLIFLIPAGLVVLLAPLYGYIVDKKGHARPMMIAGTVVGAAGFLLIGPTPLLSDPSPMWPVLPKGQLWLVCVGLLVTGGGWAVIVLTFQEFISTAMAKGFPDNLATHGLVSGVYNVFNSLGSLWGPTLGGYLLQSLLFPWASTVIAGLVGLAGVVLLVFTIGDYIYRRKTSNTSIQEDQERLVPDTEEVHVIT